MCYLDDSFTVSVRETASRDVVVKGLIFTLLGYFVGFPKCTLQPETVGRWLGMLIDFEQRTFRIPADKMEAFLPLVREVLGGQDVYVSTLQKVAGKCVSFAPAVPGALLYTREMFSAVAGADAKGRIQISQALRRELRVWLEVGEWHGTREWRSERHFRVSVKVATDASSLGWGGELSVGGGPLIRVGDLWSAEEMRLDIGVKEILGTLYTLRAGLPADVRDAFIVVETDNQASAAVLRSGRASRSVGMLVVQKEMLRFELQKNLVLQSEWISGEKNTGPDGISRAGYAYEETLSRELFLSLQRKFGGFTLDAMASVRNRQCVRFVSRHKALASVAYDIFSVDLRREPFVYCFPPEPMIGAVLAYLREQRTRGVVVLGWDWTAPWTSLLEGCVAHVLARAGCASAVAVPNAAGGWDSVVLKHDLVAFRFDFR